MGENTHKIKMLNLRVILLKKVNLSTNCNSLTLLLKQLIAFIDLITDHITSVNGCYV